MVNLYIEGKLLDQYADESVDIISSVLDVQDITKNTGDYSKEFSVPSSRRNNKIFKHWYNSSIDNGFDARTRVSGSIDIDGVPFKTGKWLLRNVKIVKGVPDSYKINFYGDTASLSETVGKDILKDLDFTSLDHAYTPDKIKEGLTQGLSNGSIIYTPIAQKGMFYDSDSATTDEVVNGILRRRNIAWNGGGSGIEYRELRPSMKVIEIIKAIEVKYGITFSRDFFGTTEFDELYIWLSADLEGKAIGNNDELIDWSTTDGSWMNTTTDVATYTYDPSSTGNDGMRIELKITPSAGFENVNYTAYIKRTDNGEGRIAQLTSVSGTQTLIPLNYPGFNPITHDDIVIEFYVVSTEAFEYSATLKSTYILNGVGFGIPETSSTSGNVVTTAGVVMKRLMPELEVTEFLRGIIQMFKLVVIGKGDKDFYVNSLDAFYRTGNRHEITKYVDFASIGVDRGEIISELDFTYEDPTTILAKKFKDDNGVGYGDSKVKLINENGVAYDGDVLTVKLPFETIVYERLTDADTDTDTTIQIGSAIDIAYEPVFTKPHLHYASLVSIANDNVKWGTSTPQQLNTNMFMPMSHFGIYSPAYSLGFESEVSTYSNEIMNNTLYSNHYQNYLEAIFNVKRRTFKVSAQLPIQIVTRLQLNDIITIDQLDYRINNFKYNLLTGRTQLELINGFDKYETNDVVLPTECFNASILGGTYGFNIPNVQNYAITSSVVGGGTPFVTESVDVDNRLKAIVQPWTSIPVGTFSRTTNLTFTDTVPTIVQGDIVRNGDFADSSEWYIPNGYTDGWIVGGGFAESTGIAGRRLDQTSSFDSVVGGCTYEVEYTISDWVSGEVGIWFGSSNGVHVKNSGNGTYTGTHVAGFDADDIGLVQINEPNHLNGIFIGKVSNLSITGCKRTFKEQGGMCITQTNQG